MSHRVTQALVTSLPNPGSEHRSGTWIPAFIGKDATVELEDEHMGWEVVVTFGDCHQVDGTSNHHRLSCRKMSVIVLNLKIREEEGGVIISETDEVIQYMI